MEEGRENRMELQQRMKRNLVAQAEKWRSINKWSGGKCRKFCLSGIPTPSADVNIILRSFPRTLSRVLLRHFSKHCDKVWV